MHILKTAFGEDLIVYAQLTLGHVVSNPGLIMGAKALAIRVALRGGQVARSSFVANWEPYCDSPITVNRRITSRQAGKAVRLGRLKMTDQVTALEVSVQAPCRRCAKCLQWRQMKWRERAIRELASSKRTWFVTLTFSPRHLATVLFEAKSGSIKDVEAAAYLHIQMFFKRLRQFIHRRRDIIRDDNGKEIGCHKAEFRYFCVYERGELNGRSHYHIFLHEIGTRPITKLAIERNWRSFVHARLVRGVEGGGSASYLTKYATKHFDIRPRASVRYGKLSFPLKKL